MENRLLTVKELAQRLGVNTSWVYQYTRPGISNTIPHVRAGKYCRFQYEEVLRWLEKRGDSEVKR
jgi:excisionase family DNA binding protein